MDESLMKNTILRPVTPERANELLDAVIHAHHAYVMGYGSGELIAARAAIRTILIGAMERVTIPGDPP